MDKCWFCDDDLRTDPPPGGWLLDDGTWRAGHTPPSYAVAGTVLLETRRHVTDQAGFDAHERATIAEVTGWLLTAIEAVTGCDRTYQWATMDRYPHFHLWLVPWWAGRELRGPRYLVESLEHADGCTPGVALRTANEIKRALAASPQAG